MTPSFKLKGSLFTLSVLQLLTTDLAQFEKDLQDKIRQAPKFFNYTPMVLDIQILDDQNLNFTKLKTILTDNQIIPVGIRGAKDEWIPEIRELGFAIMTDPGKTSKEAGGNATFAMGTKIITDPIRSGQRVYAENGDLIIVGSVSSGAELLADGNIHIYGTLRGRALAGVNGNTNARIFCLQLAAELVSIAGQYQIFEHAIELTQGLTQVYLKENELIISRV